MPSYSCIGSGTSNSVASTEDNFLEITAAASSGVGVYRVLVCPDTASLDNLFEPRLIRTTAAGSTGTAGTVNKMDPNARATASTLTVKNTTTDFTVGGSPVYLLDASINCRSPFEWVANTDDDMMRANGSTYFVVGIKVEVASKLFKCCTYWRE